MDLEEWELLPENGLVEIHDDGGKMIFSRKYASDSKNEFNMNYFICPSPKPSQFVDTTTEHPKVPNQLVPFPIQLQQDFQETPDDDHHHEVIVTKEVITKIPLEINLLPSRNTFEKIKDPSFLAAMVEAEQDHEVSQVFFKKMKENEFFENMRMDSPKSSNNKTLLPQVESDPFQYEEKAEVLEADKDTMIKKIGMGEEDNGENNGGLNLLNRSLTGIGAICSFGVAAAATICIIFIGNRQKQRQRQQSHKFRFQFFSDDKRIKQVVRHATKLNEAISAARGVPVTRAQITVGGHYDAL